MKNIFLIGDSIRMGGPPESLGYEFYMKEKLGDKVKIYSTDDNCRFVHYTLRYLHEWAMDIDRESIDVVHWNNGLWDILRLYGDQPLTSIDAYGETLERIYKRIRLLFPNAKIIFALTTAVVESRMGADFNRRNADIEAYNSKAKEVLGAFNVEFNDLYSITSDFDESMYCDGTHLCEKGCKTLADAVIKACEIC